MVAPALGEKVLEKALNSRVSNGARTRRKRPFPWFATSLHNLAFSVGLAYIWPLYLYCLKILDA